jgi:putative ABC transport system substrate-binding protein
MHADEVARPFHRDGWVYEEKYDGWRMVVYKDGTAVRLVSRAGKEHSQRFADLAAAIRALAAVGASGAQGIIMTAEPFFLANRGKIAQFAASKRLATVHFSKLFAEAGGLMSYGGSLEDSYRRAATYVDKILKGAKPADLPVEQPTKFELVINLKTAKALGLTIPPSLLQRADRVIE